MKNLQSCKQFRNSGVRKATAVAGVTALDNRISSLTKCRRHYVVLLMAVWDKP